MFKSKSINEKLTKVLQEVDNELKEINNNITLIDKQVQNAYDNYIKVKKDSEVKLKSINKKYKQLLSVKTKLVEEVLNVFKK